MTPSNAIPVVLQFSNVAANSCLNITLTTPGARWSMGRRIGDSLGFSYNVVAQDAHGNVPLLQGISFNGGILEIRTSSAAPTLSNFTLTLFLELAPDVSVLQGYCTLNNEAMVQAYLGSEQPTQWYDGRISAVLPPLFSNCRSVLLTISGLKPGINLVIEAAPGAGAAEADVNWTFGPEFAQSLGVALTSTGAAIPLSLLSYTNRQIVLQTSSGQGGTLADVVMMAYVAWEPADLPCIYLRAVTDPAVSVWAQVGTRQPQWISQTYSVFTF